ncbi:ABC transporter domain-containing protein [Psidium guajava]|nr:ABC transporter domain-containing protein [Psidium guajava]
MDGGEHHKCHESKMKKSPSRKFTVPKIDLEEIRKSSPFSLSPRDSKAAGAGKSSCLCSPTTHAGSFRCRYHRNSSISRGSSVGSNLSELGSKPSSIGDSVEAQ